MRVVRVLSARRAVLSINWWKIVGSNANEFAI